MKLSDALGWAGTTLLLAPGVAAVAWLAWVMVNTAPPVVAAGVMSMFAGAVLVAVAIKVDR